MKERNTKPLGVNTIRHATIVCHGHNTQGRQHIHTCGQSQGRATDCDIDLVAAVPYNDGRVVRETPDLVPQFGSLRMHIEDNAKKLVFHRKEKANK